MWLLFGLLHGCSLTFQGLHVLWTLMTARVSRVTTAEVVLTVSWTTCVDVPQDSPVSRISSHSDRIRHSPVCSILATRGFWMHQHPWQIDLLKRWFFSCCVNQCDPLLEFMGLTYGNLTLIGCEPVIDGQTGNDKHSWKHFEVLGAGACNSSKQVDQDRKWDKVQMIQRTSTLGVR